MKIDLRPISMTVGEDGPSRCSNCSGFGIAFEQWSLCGCGGVILGVSGVLTSAGFDTATSSSQQCWNLVSVTGSIPVVVRLLYHVAERNK